MATQHLRYCLHTAVISNRMTVTDFKYCWSIVVATHNPALLYIVTATRVILIHNWPQRNASKCDYFAKQSKRFASYINNNKNPNNCCGDLRGISSGCAHDNKERYCNALSERCGTIFVHMDTHFIRCHYTYLKIQIVWCARRFNYDRLALLIWCAPKTEPNPKTPYNMCRSTYLRALGLVQQICVCKSTLMWTLTTVNYYGRRWLCEILYTAYRAIQKAQCRDLCSWFADQYTTYKIIMQE